LGAQRRIKEVQFQEENVIYLLSRGKAKFNNIEKNMQ
jgi:hypothetical protein